MSFQRITISGSMPVVAEQRRERVAEDAVSLVLQRLQLDERLLNALHPLQVGAGDRELLDRLDDDLALLDGVAGRHLDAVEPEQVRGLLEVVDDVVDLGGQLVDVLAVERRQILGVEQRDQVAGDRVARPSRTTSPAPG